MVGAAFARFVSLLARVRLTCDVRLGVVGKVRFFLYDFGLRGCLRFSLIIFFWIQKFYWCMKNVSDYAICNFKIV